MRVLFLNGNSTRRPYRVAPLGLAFVAAATERAGHEVRFLDWPGNRRARSLFACELKTWQPHYLAVGIRNLDNSDYHGFESYLRDPAELIRLARQIQPGLKVIVGGPAGTVEPRRVVEVTGCDHLILGEGEESLPQLIARLQTGEAAPQLVGADAHGTPFRVANPAQLPSPQLYRWVKDFRPYLRGDAGYPLQTKRGCPLKCTYCTYGRIEGARYRFLDPETVADEIEGALACGIRDFEFVDSTFNLPPAHALALLQVIQARRLRANYVGTGLNPSRLPDELLAAMRAVGFQSVILTAESACDTMLASYQKNYRRSALIEAARKLQQHELKALWVFLVGGPGETPQSVAETLRFIEQNVASPNAVYITAGIRIYPGSPIGDELDQGRLGMEHLRCRDEAPAVPFYYASATPPEWLEPRLREFQRQHTHVLLSCEGHSRSTELALRILPYLPVRKPYWQHIPALNGIRKFFRKKPAPLAACPGVLQPAPQSQ